MTEEQSNAGAPDQATRLGPSNLELLGELCWLYSQSKLHQSWNIGSIQQWLVPPILTRQVRLYRDGGKPFAFVTWAWLTKEIEEAYVLDTRSLQPKNWRSGDRGWIIDWVAPFGGSRRIASDLKNNVFPDRVGRFLRHKEGSDTLKIVYVHGAKAIPKARDPVQSPTVDLKSAAGRRRV